MRPLYEEIQAMIGRKNTLIMMPMRPGQPNLTTKMVAIPMAYTGKAKALSAVINLHYITLKSLDKRFIILPISEDLMIYEVKLETLA